MNEFFTWGNLITWAVCSILIYLSLNFRLFMIFHHPDRKLRAKARARIEARRKSADREVGHQPGLQTPLWDRDCFQNSCYVQTDGLHENKTRKP
jgi:hypothetical protein